MNFEQQPEEEKIFSQIRWTKPDIAYEMGEIDRVADHFGKTPEDALRIKQALSERATQAEMLDLSEDLWRELENTDSFDVALGDYAPIRECVESQNRDYQARVISQVRSINQGATISAPIIVRYGNILHLVSGNTRLMLARAAGQTPKVVIVPISV